MTLHKGKMFEIRTNCDNLARPSLDNVPKMLIGYGHVTCNMDKYASFAPTLIAR